MKTKDTPDYNVIVLGLGAMGSAALEPVKQNPATGAWHRAVHESAP